MEGKRKNNSNDNDRKKKRKMYFKLQQKGAIEGKQGILFTCNVDQEDRCSREAVTLLTEYAEKFYPELMKDAEQDQPDVFDEDQNDLDIEAAIANEVKQLKSKKKEIRLFDCYELGAKGNFFVSINNESINPVEFVRRIFEDIIETKIPKTRFTSRMIPILGTCLAKDENIEPLAKKLIAPQFNNRQLPPKKYSFQVNIRNNSGYGSKALIMKLNEFVDLANFVQLKNFDWAIIVEIVKTTCMISITEDYLRFKRYNIREIVKTFGTEHGNSMASRVTQNDNNNNNSNKSTKQADKEDKEDEEDAEAPQQEEDDSKVGQ